MMNLALRNIFVHTSQMIFTCSKIWRCGTSGFPFEGRCAADCYHP
jgi:hypothetical protein